MAPSQSPQTQVLNKAFPVSLDSVDKGEGCQVTHEYTVYSDIHTRESSQLSQSQSLFVSLQSMCV